MPSPIKTAVEELSAPAPRGEGWQMSDDGKIEGELDAVGAIELEA